jgi:hypothetical protein
VFNYEHTWGALKLGALYNLKVGGGGGGGAVWAGGAASGQTHCSSSCAHCSSGGPCSMAVTKPPPFPPPLDAAQTEKPVLSVQRKSGKHTLAASYGPRDEATTFTWTHKPCKVRRTRGHAQESTCAPGVHVPCWWSAPAPTAPERLCLAWRRLW